MKILDTVAAFGCGVITTGIALTLYVDLSAQPVARNIVDVCANVEGTLRLTDPGVPCQASERLLRLRQPNVEQTKEQEQAQDDSRLKALQDRVNELEERAAKGRLMASRVIAPFEVINDDGYAVLKVEDGLVWFNNPMGKPVARVAMSAAGAYFEARSGTNNVQAFLGASDEKVNLFIQQDEKKRIDLGRGDGGQYGLRIYEPGGKMVAGIGQASAGDGVVTLGDTQGNQRAVMYVEPKAGGVVKVLNTAGKSVAEMFATSGGNGQMRLYNNVGAPMVEAGVNEANIGVVRAGPASFAPGVGILGLPGSYIAGKAAK
jgi:hypothetical protein